MNPPPMKPIPNRLVEAVLLALAFPAIARASPALVRPDPLRMEHGTPVTRAEQWPARRSEILKLFEEHVYGRISGGKLPGCHVTERKKVDGFLSGKATLREFRVAFTADSNGPGMDLLVVSPTRIAKAPSFLGLNFRGNHTIHPSEEITIPSSWVPDEPAYTTGNRAREAGRGHMASRWPLDAIISRGFAVATVYCGDIDPDFDDGFKNGVHQLFAKPGVERTDADWGTLGAWAWGLSRALDALEQVPEIDAKKIAVVGHSRLGKAALWAGATDPRFAIVISNNSGCGGAALSRRAVGETVKAINDRFPHWFCGNFKRYNGRESECPVDQHQLLALIAPRPLYVASATLDTWADPEGEFLAAVHAGPVYQLLGKPGLGVDNQPPPDTPVGSNVGYHLRTGKHDITAYDWERYMDFAARHYEMNRTAEPP